jgi:hypothetical protein
MIELRMNREREVEYLEQVIKQVRGQLRPGTNPRNIVGLEVLVRFVLLASKEVIYEGEVEENLALVKRETVEEYLRQAEGLVVVAKEKGIETVVPNKERLTVLERALTERENKQKELRERVRGLVGEKVEESQVDRMIRAFGQERERIETETRKDVVEILAESDLTATEKERIVKAMERENWRIEEGEERIEQVEKKVKRITEESGVSLGEREIERLRAVGTRNATNEKILGERARRSMMIGEEKKVGPGSVLETWVEADLHNEVTGERLLGTGGEIDQVYTEVLSRLLVEERLRDGRLGKDSEERMTMAARKMGLQIKEEEIRPVWEYVQVEGRIEEAIAIAASKLSEETGIGSQGAVRMVGRMVELAGREGVTNIHEEIKLIGTEIRGIKESEIIRRLNTIRTRETVAEGVVEVTRIDREGRVAPLVGRAIGIKEELAGSGVEEGLAGRVGKGNAQIVYGNPLGRKRRGAARSLGWSDLGAVTPEEKEVAERMLQVIGIGEESAQMGVEERIEMEILVREYDKDLGQMEQTLGGGEGEARMLEELGGIRTAAETALDLVPKSVKGAVGRQAGAWFFTKTALGRKVWWRGARFLIKRFGKEAVKQGIKGITSAAIKKAVAWGASALAAAPSAGTTLVIMAVIEIGSWAIKKIWKPIKSLIIKIANFLGIEIKKLGLKEMLMLGGGAMLVGGLAVPVLALGGAVMMGGGLLMGGGLAAAGGAIAALMGGLTAGLMTIGAPIALAVGIALGGIFFFHKGVMDKAMVLAPLNEGMGADGTSPPGGTVPPPGLGGDTGGTSCTHVACRVQNALAQCSVRAWTSSSDAIVRGCMNNAGISPTMINIMSSSANYYTYLQCVGFKVAVEPSFAGGWDAHNYTNEAILAQIGCYGVDPSEARVGDNVAWGVGASCGGGNCSTNISCCGHVGILTEDLGSGDGGINWFLYTSANGGNGTISTSRLDVNTVGKVFRCR